MSFTRPTLQQIIDRVGGDLRSTLNIVAILRRSFLAAIRNAIAGTSHVLHGHLAFISRQIFPDQAEDEYLDRWGSIYGIIRKPATFAKLEVQFTLTGAQVITAGTVLVRSDQVQFTLDDEVNETAAGTYQGFVTCTVAGDIGNTDGGEFIQLQSPLVNAESNVEIIATTQVGEDIEKNDSYRERIVSRIQEPPSGGTASDYIQFARGVSGVTRAWVFPGWLGQGTVGVSFTTDDEIDVIPTPPKVDEVQTEINLKKPVTAEVTVFAPTSEPVDFTIAIKPNNLSVRAAIETEIRDLFLREGQVRGGLKDAGSGLTYDGKIPLSRINEAISIAPGEEDHTLISPSSDVIPLQNGSLLTVGTFTFQTLA